MDLKLALAVLSFICINAGCAYGKPPRTCPNFSCETSRDCQRGGRDCDRCILNGYGQLVCSNGVDCRAVRCAGQCPVGECAPRSPDDCCDNLIQCSREGCCGAKCDTNNDCTPGPCRTCIVNGLGDRRCGEAEKDCSRVRCFAACPPGTCAPRTEDTCCDDIGKCDRIGCCGYKCNGDSDCKKGECRKCILNGLGRNVCGRKDKDCSNVKCFARCPPGTCSPRSEETCCDDIKKCSAKNCPKDGIDFGNCAAVSCLACPRGQCAPLDGCCPDLRQCSANNCPKDDPDKQICPAVLCPACPQGQCAPLDDLGCCPDIKQCSRANC